ncbi:MAG TPA: hypothetical protein VHT96_04635 [Clostridia bacterium]|nr:hypothetical protein [Clostridia bacterium]
MDEQQLSAIIAEVLKRLNTGDSIKSRNKALVIMPDFNSFQALEDFQEHTCGFEADLLTRRENAGLAANKGFARVYAVEDLCADLNEWVGQFEKVLVPYPSLKMISEIAHIILEDRFTEVVFSSLQEGKSVLAGPTEDEHNFKNLSNALKCEIRKLTAKMKDFGIEQIPPKNRQDGDRPKACVAASQITQPGTTLPQTGISHQARVGKVISLQDAVALAKTSGEIRINKGTVVTPLAMDYFREKKISVKHSDQNRNDM